jgi:hypothetical protein
MGEKGGSRREMSTEAQICYEKNKIMVKDHTWVLKKYFATRARNVAIWQDHLCSSTELLEFASQEK